MEGKEHLVAWLKDAYSMEKALIPILENHADDAKAQPELERRLRQHIGQTNRHASLVESCIRRHGEDTSTVKNIMGGLMGSIQGVATGMFEDELVKNALMDYASENFEIACYQALIVAAERFGDEETVSVCRDILRDEQEMAAFLSNALPNVVGSTLQGTATS